MSYLTVLTVSFRFLIVFTASTVFAQEVIQTRVDLKSGQIQLVQNNRVIQSSVLSPKNFSFKNEFDLIRDVEKSTLSKDEKKTAHLLNMEQQWLRGKRSIVVEGKEYPVDIKEVLLAIRVVSAKYTGQTARELSKVENQKIDQFVGELKESVAQLTESAVTGVKREPGLQSSHQKIETSFDEMLKTVGDVAGTSSILNIVLLDGSPYIMGANDGGSPLTYSLIDGAGATLKIKSSAGNLLCGGMTQAQPPPSPDVVLKLDYNFAKVSHFAYTCTDAECISLVNTAQGATNCTPTADIIQKSSFERGER